MKISAQGTPIFIDKAMNSPLSSVCNNLIDLPHAVTLQSAKPVIPEILPDEFYEGWLDRVCSLNNLSDISETHRWVRKLADEISPLHTDAHGENFYLAGAIVCAQELSELLRNHTLVFFWECLTPTPGADRYDQPGGVTDARKSGCFFPLDFSKVKKCDLCVQSDLSEIGFSYLRRSHQIPGIDWCMVHQCALVWLKPYYPVPPSDVVGTPKLKTVVTSIQQYPVGIPALDRYVELARFAVIGRIRIAVNDAHAKLSLRIYARSILTEGSHPWSLTKELESSFPPVWIEKLPVPFDQYWTRVVEILPGCGSKRKNYSVQLYLLAVVLLFDDAEEGLKWFNKPIDSNWVHRMLQCRQAVSSWWNEQLGNAYVASCGKNLGVEAGWRDEDAGKHLNNIGLPSVTSTSVAVLRALAMFGWGQRSLADSCVFYKASPKQVEKLLRLSSGRFLSAVSKLAKSDKRNR